MYKKKTLYKKYMLYPIQSYQKSKYHQLLNQRCPLNILTFHYYKKLKQNKNHLINVHMGLLNNNSHYYDQK